MVGATRFVPNPSPTLLRLDFGRHGMSPYIATIHQFLHENLDLLLATRYAFR